MSEDFDTLYNKYLAELEGVGQPQQASNVPFDANAYLASMGIKPKPTGLVKGTVKSLGRGVGRSVSEIGKALERDTDYNQDLGSKVGYYIDEFGNKITEAIKAPVAEAGSQREAYFQGMESLPSVARDLAITRLSGAAGAPLGPMGVAAGYGLGTAATYGLMSRATEQDTIERLSKERPDLPLEQVERLAKEQGLWEAGPEAATNLAESILFSKTKLGKGALDFAKAMGKNILKAAPLEMAGEAVTSYGQTKNLQEIYPELDPVSEAIHGANVALYPSLFLGAGGTVLEKALQPKSKEDVQPSTVPVTDTVSSTDLLNKPLNLEVSPDASLGEQQEFDFGKKFKTLLDPSVKQGIAVAADSPLVAAMESGTDSFTVPHSKGYKANLLRLKKEAEALNLDIDFKENMQLGGQVGTTVRFSPKGGFTGPVAQPEFDFSQPVSEPIAEAVEPTVDLVVENLPMERPEAGLPAFRSVSGEVLPPVNMPEARGIEQAIEDADYREIPKPLQLEAPQDFIITESGASIPREVYNQMVQEAIEGKTVKGLSKEEVKAAQKNIKQGKIKPVAKMEVTSGPVISTKNGPMPFLGFTASGKMAQVRREDGKTVVVPISNNQRQALQAFVKEAPGAVPSVQTVTPPVSEVKPTAALKAVKKEVPKKVSKRVEVESKPYVSKEEPELTKIEFEEKPSELVKLIKARADVFMDLEELKATFETSKNELLPIERSRMEDKIEEMEEDIERRDEEIKKAQKPKKASKRTEGKSETKHNKELTNLIKEGKSSKDILSNIANTHDNKIIAYIASLLSKFNLKLDTKILPNLKDTTGSEALGLYSNNLIELNEDAFTDTDMAAVYVHEALHAALGDKLSEKKFAIFKTRLNNLKVEVRKSLEKSGINPNEFYGLREDSHVDELITEVFSDKALQEMLKSVKVKDTKSYIKNLLDKFVDVFRQILGFPEDAHTALTEVIGIGLEVISDKTKTTVTEPKAKRRGPHTEYVVSVAKSQKNLLDGMVKVFEGYFPNVEKFLTNMFRNPLWIAEKMRNEGDAAAEGMTRLVENKEKKTEDYNNNLEDFFSAWKKKPALRDIADVYNKLSDQDKLLFERLVLVSDMENRSLATLEEATKASVKKGDTYVPISKEVFDLYKQIESFGRGVFMQSYNKAHEQALKRLHPKVVKKLAEILKFETWVDEDADFEAKATEIIKNEGLKSDLVKEALEDALTARNALKQMRNTFSMRKFHMPRIRKQGPYKLQIYEPVVDEKTGEVTKGKEVYSAYFQSDAARQYAKTASSTLMKDMGLNFKLLTDYVYEDSYVAAMPTTGTTGGFNVLASDTFLDSVMEKAKRVGDFSPEDEKTIRKALAQYTAETILSMSGAGKHKIKRMEEYITGFESNPIQAYTQYVQSLANSYAKAEYVQSQLDAYNDIKKVNKKAAEYALDYIYNTTKPRTRADEISSNIRYGATIYFMGASISSAAINVTQNVILGAPTLAQEGVSTTKALHTIYKYYKMVVPQIAGEIKDKFLMSQEELAVSSHVRPSPTGIPQGLNTILQWYRKSGLNYDTQTALAMGSNEDSVSDVVNSKFHVIADKLMVPFKAVEVANREATLMASVEIVAKNKGIDLNNATEEQLQELYTDGKRLVNKIHFMGSGNLPAYAQKSAIMRTLLAMQSYGINFFNLMYNSMTSGDKAEYKKMAKVFGMLTLLGGTFGAIPGGEEMNKILKRMLGYDVKLEAQKAIGSITGPELAQVITHGPFNISNNINLRIPDPLGLVALLSEGKEAGVYSAGAIGSIANRMYKAFNYASDGQWGKSLGIGSPEALARIIRAYMEYDEGFTSAKGAPVYFEGERLKASLPASILKGLTGFRTPTETNIAEVRFAKYELQQKWQSKRSVAVNKFAKGDRQAMIDFNDSLRDNDQARALVKPITGADKLRALKKKQSDREVQFEKQYS